MGGVAEKRLPFTVASRFQRRVACLSYFVLGHLLWLFFHHGSIHLFQNPLSDKAKSLSECSCRGILLCSNIYVFRTQRIWAHKAPQVLWACRNLLPRLRHGYSSWHSTKEPPVMVSSCVSTFLDLQLYFFVGFW